MRLGEREKESAKEGNGLCVGRGAPERKAIHLRSAGTHRHLSGLKYATLEDVFAQSLTEIGKYHFFERRKLS